MKNEINVKQVAKDLFCENNQLLLLLKRYKLPFEYNRNTDDTYISNDLYNALLAEQAKYKNQLLSLSELIKLRKQVIPFDSSYYLYFLFNNEELIYIGQTCSLPGRLSSHQNYKKSQKKLFNYITLLQIPSTKILSIEAFYIDKYKPYQNQVHIEGKKLINYIFESLNFKKISILDQ